MSSSSARAAMLEDIKAVIKSIIIPYKEGAGIFQIQKDYTELEGRSLPYSEFGYSSPKEFLASMSDILISGQNNYGETLYRAKFGAETSHIQAMVLGQKSVAKKKRKRPTYSGHPVYGGVRFNHLRPSVSWGTPGWGSRPSKPYYGGSSASRNRPLLPAGYGDSRPSSFVTNSQHRHTQPLNSQNNQLAKPKGPLQPLTSQNNQLTKPKAPLQTLQVNTQPKRGLTSDRPPPGPANNVRASAPFLSANDIKNIKDLLRSHGSDGIHQGLFCMLYQKKYGVPLDVKARGFSDIQHALSSIEHICKVELHPSNKYYVIKLVDSPPAEKVFTNGTSLSTKTTNKSPKSSPKNSPSGASTSNGRLDARSGLDNEQDNIIYDAKKVPPEVRSRVSEYHLRSSQPPQNEAQLRWSFKLKIMALLMKATEGISVDNFSTDYYLNFKESLDPCLYHFKDYQDMFANLSKELPIQLSRSYSGDDLTVSLINDWQSQWIDVCVANNQYDALKQMVAPGDVVLPGDVIPDVDVDPATIDADVWHPIILTSVVSPNCIFVNLYGKYYSEALDSIMGKLNFYKTSMSASYEVPPYCLRENFFCVAPFDIDTYWHRVKIVRVEPDKKRVRIRFIDFGGEQMVDSSKLRLMKKEFSYLPGQAIRLSLRGIRPKADKWPSNAKNEVLAFMNRAMNQKENILCRLHSRRPPHSKENIRYEAEICAKIPIGFIFLHKQLIQSGLAINDEVSTFQNKNEVLIPNNDVHRPIRKPTRIAAKMMIDTLKNLQSKDGKVQPNEASTSRDTQQSQAINGGTPYTNGSVDHSNNAEDKNLEDKIKNLNI